MIEIPEGIDTQSRRTLDLPAKIMTEVDNMSINEMESKARELRQLQSLPEVAERFTKQTTTRRFCVA